MSKNNENNDKEKKKKLPPLLKRGDIINRKRKIVDLIGKGAFGETYASVDAKDREVAIKVERVNNKAMVLKSEACTLKKLQDNPYVVKIISFGREEGFTYMVMERLQDNLADLRKNSKNGKFSLFTTCKAGLQLFEAIKGIHQLGYIHRDVKPHNFVTGRKEKGKIYAIDFGLARKYVDTEGKHR
jgi:serine/threonine protein kinase